MLLLRQEAIFFGMFTKIQAQNSENISNRIFLIFNFTRKVWIVSLEKKDNAPKVLVQNKIWEA